MEKNWYLGLFIFYLTLFVGLTVYSFRYELGISNPKFKEGDCLKQEYKQEFSSWTSCLFIDKVGKKDYKTQTCLLDGPSVEYYGHPVLYKEPSSLNIKVLDNDDYQKVKCPEEFKLI